MLMPEIVATNDVHDAQFDAVVVVTDSITKLTGSLASLQKVLKQQQAIDNSCENGVSVLYCADIPSNRLIFAATGPLNRDYDDVRRFHDAAENGIKRALKAGCRSPLLVRPADASFPQATRVAVLGALHATYVPLDVREFSADRAVKAVKLGVYVSELDAGDYVTKLTTVIEQGRLAYRDIGGSDPERMAPPRVAEYVADMFKDSKIKVDILSDLDHLSKNYPLLVAVNRACKDVERHRCRLIKLEYVGEGPIDTTLLLVGKGICYDTGGADIKAGGIMAGMHRDKCGAAGVAGFFQILNLWQPKGLKVIGAMAMVRNSVGSESYVADEIIVSRAGVRVRIGNTDAEGRMVMADVLCEMKEKAANEVKPELFTIATLTGHVIRAYGDAYAAVMENGPARRLKTAQKLFDAGEQSGDPFEISTIRREDFEAHSGKTESEDVLQANNKPSTLTARGHQNPSAFLIMASGLDKHGLDSTTPLPYCHLDIAGSSGPYPGIPTGSPVTALASAYVFNRDSAALGFPGNTPVI